MIAFVVLSASFSPLPRLSRQPVLVRPAAQLAAKRFFSAPVTMSETKHGEPIPHSELTVGVAKETFPLEKRVVQSPESVALLVKSGFNVQVQAGAGEASKYSDAAYEEAGATIVKGAAEVWKSDIVLKIRPPTKAEVTQLGDRTLISTLNPSVNEDLLEQLPWVQNLARRLVRDPNDAEDVAQAAWLTALERPPREASGRGLRSWLAAVTVTS